MRIVRVEDIETLTYSDAGIISPPFGYKEPLRSRLRKGLRLAIFGVFAVLAAIVMAIAILGAILHLPFLLLGLAWGYWKQRSTRKAATTESVEEQPIAWNASTKSHESFERLEAIGAAYGTGLRRRPVTHT
jgi:uncharacterized membrane protein